MTEPSPSERLELRRITAQEARMIKGGERPDGLSFADGYPSELSLETMGLFESGHADEYGPFFMVRRDDNAVIGELGGYLVSDEPTTVQIGYTLVEPEWGKGYASEAVSALIDFFRASGVQDRDRRHAGRPLREPPRHGEGRHGASRRVRGFRGRRARTSRAVPDRPLTRTRGRVPPGRVWAG